jgi:hypothetical protein
MVMLAKAYVVRILYIFRFPILLGAQLLAPLIAEVYHSSLRHRSKHHYA